VRSTLGQHIFLGSYLVMVIPLAAARLWQMRRSWSARDGRGESVTVRRALVVAGAWLVGTIAIAWLAMRWPAWWWALAPWGVIGALAWSRMAKSVTRPGSLGMAIALGGLLVAQVLVLLVSGARGPLLGLLAALGVTGFIVLARRGRRHAMAVAATAVTIAVAGVVLLALSKSPPASLENVPTLRRLSDLGRVSPGSTTWFRLQVWKALAVGWGEQLAGHDVVPDTSPLVRSIIGYGPDTQLITFDRLVLPSFGANPASGQGWQAQYLVDRAHNVILDHVATAGLIGGGLWLAIAVSIVVIAVSRVRDD